MVAATPRHQLLLLLRVLLPMHDHLLLVLLLVLLLDLVLELDLLLLLLHGLLLPL